MCVCKYVSNMHMWLCASLCVCMYVLRVCGGMCYTCASLCVNIKYGGLRLRLEIWKIALLLYSIRQISQSNSELNDMASLTT